MGWTGLDCGVMLLRLQRHDTCRLACVCSVECTTFWLVIPCVLHVLHVPQARVARARRAAGDQPGHAGGQGQPAGEGAAGSWPATHGSPQHRCSLAMDATCSQPPKPATLGATPVACGCPRSVADGRTPHHLLACRHGQGLPQSAQPWEHPTPPFPRPHVRMCAWLRCGALSCAPTRTCVCRAQRRRARRGSGSAPSCSASAARWRSSWRSAASSCRWGVRLRAAAAA